MTTTTTMQVPVELLERISSVLDRIDALPEPFAEAAELRALLTAQPQAAPDEAVAQWQSMSCGEGGRWFNIADSDAEQAKSDGFEVRALYTHPAPSQPSGRVELSRQFVDAVKQLCKDFSDLQNRPYMGDVYAALDGLLEHEQIPVAATPHPEQPQAGDEFPFAGFDPKFCPGSNPDNPQTEEDEPQASAAQSAPAGERETIRAVFLRNGFTVKEGQTDLKPYVYAAAEELLSIARASWQRTQSVGVPDVSAMARVLSDRSADACNINRADNWAMYGQEYIEDVQAMLASAPTVKAEQVQCADPCGLAHHAQAFNAAPAEALRPSLPAAGSADQPYPEGIAEDLERSDWTPLEALQWYAAGKHFDVADGRTRIIDTGAVASNALKHASLAYLELKGDAELSELRAALSAQQSAPERVSVPRDLLADLISSDHDTKIQAERALYALLASHAEGGKV